MIDKIGKAKSRVHSINDFVKAVLKFEKRRTKQNAQSIQDRVATMRKNVVTTDMIPTCLNAFSVYASVFVFACDSRWAECTETIKQGAVDVELGSCVDHRVQMKAASIFLSEYVRHQTDKKMPLDDLRNAISQHCLAFAGEHELLQNFSDAVDIVMKKQGDLLKMAQAHRTCMFAAQC